MGLALSTWVVIGNQRSGSSLIAVLVIEENNGRILAAAPDHAPSPALVMAGPARGGAGSGGLRQTPILSGAGSLRPKTKVLVYHAISSGLDLVEDRLWQAESLPFRAPTGSAATLTGIPPGQQTPTNLVDNTRRLVPAEVPIEALAANGTLILRLGGNKVELKPGGQWVEGRMERGAGQEVIAEAAWDDEVGAALTKGYPLTVLRITNVGLFRRNELLGGAGLRSRAED